MKYLAILKGLMVATAALVFTLHPARAADAVDPAETKRLHALFDARWEWSMKTFPEWATFVGDHRYGDRLGDASREAEAAIHAVARRDLAAAQSIRRESLSAKDRVSLDIFVLQLQEQLRFEPFLGYRTMSLGALGGFHTDFADLLGASPVARRSEVEQMLARLAAYPKRMDQELIWLREGIRLRWVPQRAVLDRVLPAIDGQFSAEIDKSPFFEPFTRLAKDIPVTEQETLRSRARLAIKEQVEPALRRLRVFVVDEYLPAAPASGALGSYPGGAEVYAAQVQSSTTTGQTPAQIHATGLREMARLRAEMETVMKEMKFEGGFSAFARHLNTDPKYFHTSAEALLAGYRDIAKRIDPELPKLFAELPRAPYGVRAMPSHFSTDRAEYYTGPGLEGTRAGWFNANAQAYGKRPIWAMETLVAHEAVPGHHLQIARAVELGELPRFRRGGGYTVFAEGWALYAETLGFDLGLYKDPLSRFGHLQWQALRAARLVVDTGIHALGWSRQQAVDYMIERTGWEPNFVNSEVDRYYSWPAQALAYMTGELKIIELRDRAKAKLGERFDIRQFHRVVLDQGSVPLPVLERAVDGWIAELSAAKKP
ncbi:MAG: DUF885 domain-containing protein [Burkholderiales bacterium]|nr:DUF885 domain-containing protein [Burkholderiales bacterium]